MALYDNKKEAKDVMRNLNKLNVAAPIIRAFGITTDRGLKERKEFTGIVIEAKNQTTKKAGGLVPIARGNQILKAKGRQQ